MVTSHLIWLLRTRGIRKRAKEQELTFDEAEEGIAWQAKGIDFEAKFWGLIGKSDRAKDEDGTVEEEMAAEALRVDQKNTVVNGVV